MTPETRKTLNLLLGKHSATTGTSFRQMPANATAPDTLVHLPTTPLNPSPPAGNGQWKKCSTGKPNCGLLHDTISLQWGGYRDLVDELKAEMAQNYDAFVIVMRNFNEQLRIIREAEQRANL